MLLQWVYYAKRRGGGRQATAWSNPPAENQSSWENLCQQLFCQPLSLLSFVLCPSAYVISRQELYFYLPGRPFLQGPVCSTCTHTPCTRSCQQEVSARWVTGRSCEWSGDGGVGAEHSERTHGTSHSTYTEAAQGIPHGGYPGKQVWECPVYFTLLIYLVNSPNWQDELLSYKCWTTKAGLLFMYLTS